MIPSLLIANRGEIACRIIRTARRLGVRTIAVYSDADASAPHVTAADEAIHIGPSPARDSYLRADRIVEAARQAGAAAVHPGYGFLSENAEFADAVLNAGLIWVGPRPESIRAMGLKDAAKALMRKAGVPVTPGYMGKDQSPERLAREAEALGFPVLLKAVAGGGGKGMRRVDRKEDFADALGACRREAAAAFGEDRVLLEKWISNPRHIEVQIFGDAKGNIVHLFERDCSLQRRHQKVVEEAPAPGMDEATRQAVCQAAISAARAVNYVGAGTVEFIADTSEGLRAERIWFMEMNTRLQVEHPVTEAITGVDLVEWQLRVASGEGLPLRQEEFAIHGWAMEARLYAEDPARNFLPSIGRLEAFRLGSGCRVDSGVGEGGEVSTHYDPMIAKLIAHGTCRDEARHLLATALRDTVIWPVRTNAGFLVKALESKEFAEAAVDTGWIERAVERLVPPRRPSGEALAAAAARLCVNKGPVGWRLNAPPRLEAPFLLEGEAITLPLPRHNGAGQGDGQTLIAEDGQCWQLQLWRADGGHHGAASDGTVLSPMPGRVMSVAVSKGEKVTKGQRMITLEAMKMEHNLTAPFDGVVAELAASEGGLVSEGTVLARIDEGQG